jgi:hypothetical protein
MVFTALLGSGFQRCSVLGFRVQRLLSSLAGTFQLQLPSWTNWLPTAELTTHNGLLMLSRHGPHRKYVSQPSSIVASRSYSTDRIENIAFKFSIVACYEALSSNGRVCRAVPKQRLSLLASQFFPWADIAQYIWVFRKCSICIRIYRLTQ